MRVDPERARPREKTIKGRLFALAWATSAITLVLALIAFSAFDLSRFRADLAREQRILAQVLGDNSRASLLFNDAASAEMILGALRNEPSVTAAGLYLPSGRLLGTYLREPGLTPPPLTDAGADIVFGRSSFTVVHPIRADSETVGTLVFQGDLNRLRAHLRDYLLAGLLVALASLAAAALLASVLRPFISRPITGLVEAAKAVEGSGDYSVRVSVPGILEIANLARSFNAMLGQIEDRDRNLVLDQEELEQRVELRTRDLAAARMAADEANQAKSSFLARMSHELRTPLHGISGMVELLHATSLDDRQRRCASTIGGCSATLLKLVTDILDFSRIEAGRLELELALFDPREAIEAVLEMFAEQAIAKGLRLTSRVDPALPAGVRGDSLRFRQILGNLVGNAVKFTESGEVGVTVTVVAKRSGQVTVSTAVADTGAGIPADRQAAIFESFTQADGSMTRRYGGSGLGLAICRQLVTLMGGELQCESQVGRGSIFTFRIDLATEADAELLAGGGR